MSRSEQTEQRREAVINAACEIFARYGYRKASMQDIAQAAGLSKSVLFKYFGTKEELYRTVFSLSAQGIAGADNAARAERQEAENVFETMRRTVDARMQLFSRLPWIYAFSYAAAFDPDPFVRTLVAEEYARRGIDRVREGAYRNLRSDISPAMAQKLILWVSQGFLEEKRNMNDTKPEMLKHEYAQWIDILERLLTKEGETI